MQPSPRSSTFSALLVLGLVAAPLAALLLAPPGAAATVPVTHTYDEFFGNGLHVGVFYPGFVYSGDDTVYCDYNSGGYPTSTPPCAVVPTVTGIVSIASSSLFESFDVDVASGGFGSVTIEGFSAGGILLASTTCGSSYGSYVRCGIFAPGMSQVTISGSPNYYVFDTATFGLAETIELPNLAVKNNGDGTCTVYDDANGNGVVDAGEALATVPCSVDQVPVDVPGAGASQSLPALSTPDVPPTPVTTPPVVVPATCTLAACTAPTVIPGQSTPALPQVCVPFVVCVGPVSPQPLTPPVTVPPVCSVGFVCLPPTTILPGQTVTVPGQPPVPLTPAITVSVSSTGFDGTVEPNAGELSSIGPITTTVGPIPVTLCPSTCPVPVPPGADLVGSVTVTVTVGTTTYTQTVPVNV